MMQIHFISLFPEILTPPLSISIMGRAVEKKLVSFYFHQLRDFAHDKHRTVDDIPYGGGAGMVMKPEPLFEAIESIPRIGRSKVIYPSPQGPTFKQTKARELSQWDQLIFICGRYEGIDQRVIDALVDEEISIGNYVLAGGELPALLITEALLRELPGVVGKEESVRNDSFQNDLLDYPAYTRPEIFRDREVPKVLLSGNHAEIEKWRLQKSVEKTQWKQNLDQQAKSS